MGTVDAGGIRVMVLEGRERALSAPGPKITLSHRTLKLLPPNKERVGRSVRSFIDELPAFWKFDSLCRSGLFTATVCC